MVVNTTPVARAVAAAYDFTSVRTIIDVGGGRGALALGLLAAHPQLRGIVFDQPAVAAGGRARPAGGRVAQKSRAGAGERFGAGPGRGRAPPVEAHHPPRGAGP